MNNTGSLSLKKLILIGITALSLLLSWLPWASLKFSSKAEKDQFMTMLNTELSPEAIFGSSYSFMDSALQSSDVYKDGTKALKATVNALKDGGLSLAEASSVSSKYNKLMKSADSLTGAMSMMGLYSGSEAEDAKALIGLASFVTGLLFWGGLLFGALAIYSVVLEKFKFTRIIFTILRVLALLTFLLVIIGINDGHSLIGLTFWAILAVFAAFPAGFHNLYLSKLLPDSGAAALPAGGVRMPSVKIPARPASSPVRDIPTAKPDTFKPVADLPASVSWLCKSCGGINKGSSLFCEFCGTAKPTFLVCPSCGTPSKSGGKFCAVYGGAVPPITSGPVCASCGHENPMGSAFCQDCGTKL